MACRMWYALAVTLTSGPTATVNYQYRDPVTPWTSPVPYTNPSLTAALTGASTTAAATIFPACRAHALVVYGLPAVARVGEVGLVPSWTTITSTMVRSMFGALPADATLNVSVVTRDQAEAVGLMSLQTVAIPVPVWRSGGPVTLATAQSGFVAISLRRAVPAAASHIVNGAKHVYTDALFFPAGFADIAGLPGYMTPPPGSVASINDLVTEVGFRDTVLAAGGPDLFAGAGFDSNVAVLLDYYTPDPLVMAVANMVGDVMAKRAATLAVATGAGAIVFCGDMAEVGAYAFNIALRERMNTVGMPVPFAFATNCATQEVAHVQEGLDVMEWAAHRP